ncbi:asparagine synthase-related protein [Paenibacillus methanolicus]|nr:asparagine synthase-related protein [Paenibacillus methanolicus]
MEELPRRQGNDYLITADAIIDNRDELFQLLGIEHEHRASVTDSELIMLAYERWGYDCPQHLIGDYAFAIWDKRKRELYCARDAVGARSLYYSQDGGNFGFCTIEKPLLGTVRTTVELNERWLADFLAIDSLLQESIAGETVYEGIQQLLPAHYGIWREGRLETTKYWDPLQLPPIRYNTDEEYVEAFNRIFRQAVDCRLRSAGEVGIMLSGGLDSGSVACLAAERLGRDNRRLHAFSSVPVRDFGEKPGSRHHIFDEAEQMRLIGQAYPNINQTYCSFEGRNALTDVDKMLNVFAHPYKIFQNMTWYRPMLNKAADEGCTIMLNGQFGNATISYGEFTMHLLTLYRSGRLVSLYKEIKGLSRLINQPVKRVGKLALKVITPYWLRSMRDRKRHPNYERLHNTLIKPALAAKWNVTERLEKMNARLYTERYFDYEEDKSWRVNPLFLLHVGAVETKLSLENGITVRDPSRDRRLIEFCLAIPSDQYVREGLERRLIRRAMKGILPEPIRTNITTHGVQSADWMHRLEPAWASVRTELDQIVKRGELEAYADMDKVRELQAALIGDKPITDEEVVWKSLMTIILSRFLMDFRRCNQQQN